MDEVEGRKGLRPLSGLCDSRQNQPETLLYADGVLAAVVVAVGALL
jgi:hypothetical protein